MLKAIRKITQSTPLIGVIVDSFKSSNPRQNAPSIQAVIDNLDRTNLVMNSDFKIWQRGEELTITNGQYSADRWRLYAPNTTSVTLKKVENGLQVVSVEPSDKTIQIYQLLEHDVNLEGLKCTSSQCVNGVVTTKSVTLSNSWSDDKYIQVATISLKEGDIANWVKVECGDEATMYIPPNANNELVKCQLYYEVLLIEPFGCPFWSYQPRDTFFKLFEYKEKKRVVPTIRTDISNVKITSQKTQSQLDLSVITNAIETWDKRWGRLCIRFATQIPSESGEVLRLGDGTPIYLYVDVEIY